MAPRASARWSRCRAVGDRQRVERARVLVRPPDDLDLHVLVERLVLGILAAVFRGGLFDVLVRTVSLVGVAMPIFFLALLSIDIFYVRLGIAPEPSRLSFDLTQPPRLTGLLTIDSLAAGQFSTFLDALAQFALPALVLATWSIGLLVRITRTSMLSVMHQDFLRTARARGARSFYVVRRHAFKNALIPVVGIIGLSYGDLLSGSIRIETMFSWAGIGRYAYTAALHADFAAIIAVSLVIAVAYTDVGAAPMIAIPRRRGVSPVLSRLAAAGLKALFLLRAPQKSIGLGIILLYVVLAFSAPLWVTADPLAQDVAHRLSPPSVTHPFGTDVLGRDIFSRVVYGGRISIPAALAVVAAGAVIGTAIGSAAGFLGGVLDEILMRITDMVLAFPVLVLAMAVAAAFGASVLHGILALVAVW
jgi:ABC-type dipeptide/oligopeptide/nickel transport system permease component